MQSPHLPTLPRLLSRAKTKPFLLAIVAWLLCFHTAWTADLQRLSGHVPAAAAKRAPLGRLDGAKHLQLSISLPSRDADGLNRFVHALYDPASPQYRHFITPEQFTVQFGPTQASYQALTDFAKANGFTVKTTHANRLILTVDGAVTDIEKAFHVTMQVYQHPTERRQFYAPSQDPSVNFGQPILHISGLDNYALPRPNLKPRPAGLPNISSDHVGANTGSGPSGAYAGNDFRTAYVPGTTLTGSGQSVALLEFDGYYASDITSYETQFGLPNIPLVNVPIDGGVTTIGEGNSEVCLDIEMVIAMSPGVSTIYVYESSGSWIDMLSRMATDNLAKQLSCSWYIPNGAAEPAAETIFQEMASQGQSFFAASGDSDAYTGLIPFPSDSPNITQVGGTTLTTGAGGVYASESVWNWGGGEGSSGGVSTNYSLPSWQQGISMTSNLGSTTMRNVPDVALTADNVFVTYNNGGSGPFGGTSCAAPLWAAFTALVNQQAVANGRPTVGFLNPTLYTLALGSSYNTDYHDVTTGNDFSPSSGNKFPAVTGYDLATGLGSPTTALITALAGPPDALFVSGTDLSTQGPAGGPFVPASTTYTLNNSGTSSINWTASTSQPWLTVSPSSGTLGANSQTTFTVSPNSGANSLAAGTYTASVTVTDVTTGVAQSRTEKLVALGPPSLTVSPSTAFAAVGNPGGPFAPSSVTYTLTNTGAPAMNWTASNSSSWLSLSPTSGTLAAGASTTVTASVTSAANGLALGTYTDTINFTNSTNGTGSTAVGASLNVNNQVQVPMPPQSTTYSGYVRGYWFTAPASFVITGLQVPTDASTGAQSIAVLKLTSTPPIYPSTTDTFTTLFLTQNNSTAGIIPVNIQVNQGDVIGLLGQRAEINSYGNAPYTTQILGQSVTFARFGMQFPLDANPPQSVWADNSTGSLSRVNMYITGNTLGPIITSAFSASANVGQPFSYQISATNSPTSYNATGLPAGLSVDTTTGIISGTPTTAGTSTVTISATNASGTGTATLTINALPAPPIITSTLSVSGSTSEAFSYTITASNNPTSFSASGLPAGLTLNSATGLISGTPTAAGTSNVTIGATNAGGSGSAVLVINVALGAPVITSSLTATATVNSAFSYSITATGSPTSYNATGLPAGLSVNTATGLISGTPTTLGTSNVTISATNSVNTATANLTLTVAMGAPVINSATYVTGTVSQPFTYTITATNSPTSYNATGLPAGLSVNTSTGVISGTPTATGYTYPTISATNASGTGSAQLEIYIAGPPPVITSPSTASGAVNAIFSYTITASGSPYSFSASGLPSGFSINSSTGVISGIPIAQGTANITISAMNGNGTGGATVALTFTLVPPIITSPLNVRGTVNTAFSYQITAINGATSYSATGLPNGLSLNPSTGLISGTPATTGISNVAITATNALGTGSALLTLTTTSTAPTPVTAFYYNGVGYVAGAGLGAGLDTPATGYTFTPQTTSSQGVYFSIIQTNYTNWWYLDTYAPSGATLALGSYVGATRYPFEASTVAGLSWDGNGAGDNTLLGSFNILDLQNAGSTAFAADFVQYDEMSISSWDIGSIRYNSTVPITYPAPPVIVSSTASVVSTTSETLSATVNPAGPPTTVSFSYGPTSSYGNTTTVQTLPAAVTGSVITATLTGLQPATIYHYRVVATNAWGSSTSADATFTTGQSVPVVFSPSSETISLFQFFTYGVLASNHPIGYFATGLPSGLTINSSTGVISGYPSVTGSFAVTLGASNAAGTGSATFTLVVTSPVPAINSPLTASGGVNVPFSYNITATNSPTTYNAINLPPGLTINTSTGLISGTPTVTGTGNVTITATNSYGTGSATLVLSLVSAAPVITSTTSTTGSINTPFTYTITATNSPSFYSASGLPPGLSLNSSTGVVSGTPTTVGTNYATVRATNAIGTGSASVTISILSSAPPAITSTLAASGTTGTPFTYTITATGSPTSYGATGLPAGLSVNGSTGVISGTPVTAGTSNVTIRATNAYGTGSATLVLTVAQGAPVITSSLSATATVNTAFSYNIAASGNPTAYNATGLPAGLSVNTSTGLISGTPTTLGTSNVTISATNTQGTGSATLVLTVAVPRPVITSNLTAVGTVSTPFTYTITASNSPTSYFASGLPSGLTVNTSTGVISGTPNTAGTSNATISATNAGGTGSATLAITISAVPSFPGFVTTGTMSMSRLFQTTTLLGNGKVLAAGGTGPTGSGTPVAEVYDPSVGTWTLTGSLNMGRYAATATLLPNGKVLTVGGFNASGALTSAELYDPATGTWTVTGSLNVGRYEHTAVLLANGEVLVAGGFTSTLSDLASAEIYNPATGTWSMVNPMNTARYFASATLLPSGQVLVAGGGLGSTVTADAEIYDPMAGTWTTINPMPTAALGHSLTVLPNGTVLCAGGVGNGSAFTTAAIFNPATGGWTATGSMANQRCRHAASLLPNGVVLVAGGGFSNGTPGTTAELYNYQTGTWSATGSLNASRETLTATLLPNGETLIVGGGTAVTELYEYATGTWTSTTSMASSRFYPTSKLLPNGLFLVAGGYNSGDTTECELYNPTTATWTVTGSLHTGREQAPGFLLNNGKVLVAGGYSGSSIASAELYDPSLGTWSVTGSMSTVRAGHTGTLLANGQVLVTGSAVSGGGVLASCELYNPASGTWNATGAMNVGRAYHVATLLTNGDVLVAGGYIGGTTASAEIYNPSTGTWTATGNMNAARDNFTATLLPNGNVLVVGGLSGGGGLASTELYNPTTGKWTTTGSLTYARYLHSATLLPNGKVMVTGGDNGSATIGTTEIYDPATGTWTVAGSLADVRANVATALLPNGKVLIAGGFGTSNLATAELFDPGLAANAAWQPSITSATSPLLPGANLVLGGSGFTGVSGAATGNFADSPTNYPVVQLMALESGQTAFLPVNPGVGWSATSFASGPVTGFPYGYALATVFTNGVPSNSALVNIQPSSNASLSNLVLSAGTLTPTFASSTASYSTSVTNDVGTITVIPTLGDSNASVQVNGTIFPSGTASAPINLAVGANLIAVAVLAQDGTTSQTYTVNVTRGDTVITTQAGSQTVASGGDVTFSVSATGTGPFTYQWYYNGVLIPGATDPTYTVNGVSQSNAGNYWIVVTNVYGTTTSSPYTLGVTQSVPAMPPWGYAALSTLLLLVGIRALTRRQASAS